MSTTKFNVTYDIVTEESAENGDVDEQGFISEGVSLREAVGDLFATRTCAVDGVTAIEGGARWITVNNGMEFETGDYESRALHFPEHLTDATRRRICNVIGASVYF